MTINRDNYESYLVDYAEGTLPESMVQVMEQFLSANPDIREELEVFQEAFLEDKKVLFTQKQDLKKIPFSHIDAHSELFQQKCVAYVEQLMPDAEIPFFLESVQNNAAKKRELNFFKQIILKASTEIFDEKLFLKQGEFSHVINLNNFEAYCVASMEGWLDQRGLAALNNYLKDHPEQRRVLDLFYKTRLVPEVSVFYPQKRQLKRFSLLSNRSKKILTFISSAAAVILFGAMLYYSSQVENSQSIVGTTLVSANLNKPFSATESLSEQPNNSLKKPNNENKLLLSDPFGYRKVQAASNHQVKELKTDELNPVTPISLSEIDCRPCKEVFTNNKTLKMDRILSKLEQRQIENLEQISENEAEPSKSSRMWNVAQAGIKGFTKLTNTELIIKKEEKNDKTKIAFNSKYFAFSTQLE